ncbi:hypothetical protein N7519_003678 [Penicillium mononematosum]|uniref:uncharacterized protein n=1 Tax=Penicillium mononematosum TaxID=268346 RepID=UPI0025494E7B|nr:uncharacterized protein N7519_003678 [Penicillium mononematosum]KAJ6188770.1 hypothetical protein N7519_003678 [Penicillium mononematosum]
MVAQSLASLLQRASIDDHEEVLQSCNAVLTKSKSNLQAQHMKVVALLKLDRYEEALKTFQAGGDALKQSAGLEYAYASYKCGKLEEATEALTRAASGRGASHLEAQVRYRAENFRRAAELYEQLSKDAASSAHEVNDLSINSWATDAQLQWKGETEFVRHDRLSREDLESFETTYNAACLNIAKGEFKQSEVLLNRAQNICRTSEDLSPEDKAAEMLPIAVQQLYVLIQLGKLEEAEAVLKDISVENITELSTKKIARNNIVLARPTDVNPYILYKALHDTPDAINNDRLFEFQDPKAQSKRPSPSTDAITNLLSVFNAAAHAQGETGPKALKQIVPLLERRPTDIGLLLTVVQLYVSGGNTTSAITAMERTLRCLEGSNESIRFNPGLLSVLVSLYQREGPRAPRVPPPRSSRLLLLHSEDRADLATAGDLFRGLHQQDPNDRIAIAGYVASQATLDYAQIESELDRLPAVSDLIADVDVSALESAGISPSASSVAAAAAAFAGARKRTAASADDRANKRVRKSRLPKDFDPAKKPDPERWLPVRDRSSYRPKGKKGKQRAAALTQGGPVNEKTEESPAQQQQKSGGGSNAKKNKKKGKR